MIKCWNAERKPAERARESQRDLRTAKESQRELEKVKESKRKNQRQSQKESLRDPEKATEIGSL